ncbi:MAG TPA: acetyl-CoA carboxylase biotin carboxyl carrier protein [Pirellulales bacterium]|jgi:acetyl-CoA carboxylase biotin carboxyl carrier protein|nr:acetyl-CoA carboxylase biotin carboxyl carrier protein [Pirellulales bacterium]
MSNASSGSGDIFDVRKIRRLVELMNEHDLGEMDLRDGDHRIRLRKHQDTVVASYEPRPQQAPAPATEARPAAPAAAEPARSEANMAVIKSPMVGTFFVSPSPEAPAFIKVGDHVGPETTVCIIEAMKVFNEIPAELAGQIVAVLVENGEPVEFNQPLFKVDTRQ